MSYLWAGHDPAVRWLAGSAPDEPGPDGAVQLALSDEVARVLGVGAGDTFQAMKADRTFVPVLVTGVFDAKDPDDPVWTSRPEILRPRVVGQSNAPTTVVGGLLSAASLPAARAALEPDGVTRTFRFPVEPQALDYAGSGALATQVAALEASPELMLAPGPGARVTSRLDLVLTQVRARVAATWSQATVVLAGLGWGTVLVLLVGADLLARRRSAALRTVRARGASLPGIAAEAGAEAAVVVGVGGRRRPGARPGRGAGRGVVALGRRRRGRRRRAPRVRDGDRRAQRRPTGPDRPAPAGASRSACARCGACRSRPRCSCSRPLPWSHCVDVASCRSPAPPTWPSRLRPCSSRRRVRCCCGARSPCCCAVRCGSPAGRARRPRSSPSREPVPPGPCCRSSLSSSSRRSSRCAVPWPAPHAPVRRTARGTRWGPMSWCARRCPDASLQDVADGWRPPTVSTPSPSAGCRTAASCSTCGASMPCGCSPSTRSRTASCSRARRSGPRRRSRCSPTHPAPRRPAPLPVPCPHWSPSRCWAPGRRCAGAT